MAYMEIDAETVDTTLVERGKFLIKIAESPMEIMLAKQLRYDVFRAEQGRLNSGVGAGIDEDSYDRQFTHLLVIDKELQRVVGTYRMQSGETAERHLGFYSSSEYEITGLRRIAPHTWEVGRSCVAPEYRSGAVIALLWGGIAAMHKRANFRYLIGCGSLELTNPDIGWAMYDYFSSSGALIEDPYGIARTAYKLPPAAPGAREWWRKHPDELLKFFPPLFKGYLRLGAKIAGEPALDQDFGSIDFLILFDFDLIAARYARHFEV